MNVKMSIQRGKIFRSLETQLQNIKTALEIKKKRKEKKKQQQKQRVNQNYEKRSY